MAKKLVCYPFINGNLLDYVNRQISDDDAERIYNGEKPLTEYTDCGRVVEWRPNAEIELTLHYQGYTRGRSSVTFCWIDDDGHEYPMFVKDVSEMLKENAVSNPVHAVFTFNKRGANYGIKFLRKV